MEYVINYEKVLEDPNIVPAVKDILRKLNKNEFLTLGEFFKSVSDDHLLSLCELVSRAQEDKDVKAQANLVVLTEALSTAEGCASISKDELFENCSYFCVMCFCTSLERREIVEIKFENVSFGSEMNDADIVRIKPGIDINDYL